MRNTILLALAVSLSAAMPAIAAAQLGTEPARVEAVAAAEPGTAVAPQAAGPRVTSHFTHDTQVLMPKSAIARLAPADEGGNHTIVISTLALVLGIILIVVLVSR
jgi:hypothetical protein